MDQQGNEEGLEAMSKVNSCEKLFISRDNEQNLKEKWG